MNRRLFLKILAFLGAVVLSFRKAIAIGSSSFTAEYRSNSASEGAKTPTRIKPIDMCPISEVWHASGGSAEENMGCLINMIGGLDKFVGVKDIVVIKPNAQWWNQGMTNTDAIKAFMEAVLDLPGFKGEIVLAENHHYKGLNSRGWTTGNRNGKYNLNELIEYFNRRGFKNVTKYHWQDGGANPRPLEGNDGHGKKVTGPADGDGYVWDHDNIYIAPNGNKCMMTYPIFTSSYSGITIDLKNGPWLEGRYLTDRKAKFINFSALNHHGIYCGATASIKNLMGVVDMTCGFQSPEPENYYNFHFVGVKKYVIINHLFNLKKIGLGKIRKKIWESAYDDFRYTGGALGFFIKNIRKPDLNIVAAHWVGWGSRTDTSKSSKPRAMLCSVDPVALDYVSTKEVLLNATPLQEEKYRYLNNPDEKNGPLYKFLSECHKQGAGEIEPSRIAINSNVASLGKGLQ